jgi:hypothetical protein
VRAGGHRQHLVDVAHDGWLLDPLHRERGEGEQHPGEGGRVVGSSPRIEEWTAPEVGVWISTGTTIIMVMIPV